MTREVDDMLHVSLTSLTLHDWLYLIVELGTLLVAVGLWWYVTAPTTA